LAANVLAEDAKADQPAQSGGLPPEIVRGLAQLAVRPVPRVRDVEAWLEIVADAQRLVTEGWAERALALGWAPRDLFGVGKNHSDEFEGLAVWLCGRRILLLDEHGVIATDERSRFHYSRQGLSRGFAGEVEVVPLWRFAAT